MKWDNIDMVVNALSELVQEIDKELNEDDFKRMHPVDLTHEMSCLRDVSKTIGASKAVFTKLYDHIRFNALPNKMEEEGLEGFTVTGIGRVSLTSDIAVTIPAKLKLQAYEWIVDEGHGDLITETINAQTLASFVKKQMRDGLTVPDKLFSIRPFTRATITKR